MRIVHFTKYHWPDVEEIYLQGIATGQATFETESPGWKKWDASHLDICRLAAIVDEKIVGWAALLPVSNRSVYRGVAEESIYVSAYHQGAGVGSFLLKHLVDESEKQGIYSLQAVMFPENIASVQLHERNGFRKIGYKRQIAKLDGQWRDTVLYERRSDVGN